MILTRRAMMACAASFAATAPTAGAGPGRSRDPRPEGPELRMLHRLDRDPEARTALPSPPSAASAPS